MRVHVRGLLGHGTGRLGHVGRARGGGRLGRAGNSAQKPWEIRKSFSFSKLFCKLQTNLNPNQIWISMTSIRTIKYKSTSSHQEKYATAWMQQIIIHLNI
jgi:hypothetical protein